MGSARVPDRQRDERFDLGIDTASAEASVAVLRGDNVLAERRWTLETTFSQELLAAIDALLREALRSASTRRRSRPVARDAIASIAVDAGPGGYSGLRTGVATAQGLALALDAPLAGVSRLEADAFPHLDGNRAVAAVHDLGRGRVAWGAYSAESGVPVTLVEPRIDTFEQCARDAPLAALWCGELNDELRAAREAAGRSGDLDAGSHARSAAGIVWLARLHDAYTDPAAVDVVYLRPPPITTPRARSR